MCAYKFLPFLPLKICIYYTEHPAFVLLFNLIVDIHNERHKFSAMYDIVSLEWVENTLYWEGLMKPRRICYIHLKTKSYIHFHCSIFYSFQNFQLFFHRNYLPPVLFASISLRRSDSLSVAWILSINRNFPSHCYYIRRTYCTFITVCWTPHWCIFPQPCRWVVTFSHSSSRVIFIFPKLME